TDKHFKAAGLSQEPDQFLLLRDLRIALHEEWDIDLFGDHLLQQLMSLRVFIEIVGCEHHHANAGGLRPSETFHRRLDRLAADLSARDFDDRAKITGEGTAARGINAEHGNDVSL